MSQTSHRRYLKEKGSNEKLEIEIRALRRKNLKIYVMEPYGRKERGQKPLAQIVTKSFMKKTFSRDTRLFTNGFVQDVDIVLC